MELILLILVLILSIFVGIYIAMVLTDYIDEIKGRDDIDDW